MANFFENLLRAGEGRLRRRLERIAADVAALEDAFEDLTDEELAGETAEFRQRYADGEPLDAMLPEAFAAVREAAKRTLGMRPLRRAGDGRRRAPPRQHRRDEDR